MNNRSLLVNGRRTSVSLETEFWDSFKEIAARKGVSTSELATRISSRGYTGTFSSALRVFILATYKSGTSQQNR